MVFLRNINIKNHVTFFPHCFQHHEVWQGVHSDNEFSTKYSASANSASTASRKKRAPGYGKLEQVNAGKNSCFMSLMSDVVFWERYLEKASGVRAILLLLRARLKTNPIMTQNGFKKSQENLKILTAVSRVSTVLIKQLICS